MRSFASGMVVATLLGVVPVAAQAPTATPPSAPSAGNPLNDGAAALQRGDYATAMRLWAKLAEAGDSRAQANMGILYANGLGVPRDPVAAAQWFRRAAESGNSTGQSNLAGAYLSGAGVEADPAAAALWYRRAADQGNADAQFNLGVLYEQGTGVPLDYDSAVRLYRQAAAHGHAAAQGNLGAMYASGRGVPADLVQAYQWFTLGIRNTGDERVRDALEANLRLAVSQMTPAQVAQARERNLPPGQPTR